MARRPKPWYRKARRAWFVTLDGVQHNLGPEKEAAYERFFELMRQPKGQKVASQSMAAIADAYLDWVQKHRSPETFEWYRYRLERFVRKHPDLRASDVRPFHVETWVDEYQFSQTSRRNYLRSVKRCLKWAVKQGYLDKNPVADLEVPAGEHKEVVISPVEFDRLMAYIRNQKLADLVTATGDRHTPLRTSPHAVPTAADPGRSTGATGARRQCRSCRSARASDLVGETANSRVVPLRMEIEVRAINARPNRASRSRYHAVGCASDVCPFVGLWF